MHLHKLVSFSWQFPENICLASIFGLLPEKGSKCYNRGMDKDVPVTKKDVEEIVVRVVHRIVGGIVGDAMLLISERFDQVDDHEARLKRLEQKSAA